MANGRRYTERVFNWSAIVDRYEILADRILARARTRVSVPPG